MSRLETDRAIADAVLAVGNTGSFPASFDGSRPLFALALFALIWVSTISLGMLWQSLADVRARPTPWREPLGTSRLIEAGFLLTIVLGAFPDTLVMLAWGEVSPDAIHVLLHIDKACDLACSIPFTIACWLRVRAGPIIGFQLIRQPVPMDLRPSMEMLRDKIGIAGLIGLIAAGVAAGK